MRNILAYPITTKECIEHIERYGQAELNSGAVGGTGPLCSKWIAEYLRKHEVEFHVFLEFKQKAVVKDAKGNISGKQG